MGVLGITKPDLVSELLGTGFRRFYSSTGINGLAKMIGEDRLDILAVDATNPGTGQFRVFIEQAKKEFATIYLWEVWNPILAETLQRYGFQACTQVDKDTGEILNGYRHDGVTE